MAPKLSARASLNGVRIAQAPAPKGAPKDNGNSSSALWVPNNYVSVVPLNLSNDYVPTQQEVSGQGAMCGGLAPAARAEPKEVEDEVDKILREEGFDQGLNTKLPTLEETEVLVARRLAPEGLLKAVKRLEEGKKKVRKARKQNRDFALAMAKWNATDFAGADKALRAYVKEFSKKPDEDPKEESPWVPEALIHIADLAKFNGQANEAEANYKKVLEMTSSDTSEMSYEAHLKAYERWADLYIWEGRFGEARPMLENIVYNDVHWRRRTWAQYWLMQLNAFYAGTGGAGIRLADLGCGTQALAALLVDLGRSRDARRVAAIEPKSARGFSLAELKTIALQQKVAMVGFRATPDALTQVPLPALLHYSPPMEAQARNAKVLKTSRQDVTGYGHYVVARAYDAKRGLWSILNPQNGTSTTINAQQLAKEWSGAGLMLTKQPAKTANSAAQERSRWLALWPRDTDGQSNSTNQVEAGALAKVVASAPARNSLARVAYLSSDEMRRIVGTCYVVHANSQNGERSSKVPVRTPCSSYGEPSVSIDPIDQNIFITDTPIWYNPAKGPKVEFRMAYNSLLASNYNGTVGNKWTHNYGAFLTEMPNQVTHFGGDGSQDVYTLQSNGTYRSPNGVYTKLVKTNTHTFTLESQEGDREYYGIPAGQNSTVPMLLEQCDRWGQSLTIQYQLYGGQVVPWTLTDADGKVTNFSYTSGRLTSIRVPDNRRAYFTYDGNGNLSQCKDVAGQTFTYYYDNMVVLNRLVTPQGEWGFVSSSEPYTVGNTGFNKVSITDPLGSTMVTQYDNKVVHGVPNYTHTDRRGFKTTFGVKAVGGISVIDKITTPEGYVQELEYDPVDPYQPIKTREPLTNSTLEYNSKGNLFRVVSRANLYNSSRTLELGYNGNGIDVQSANTYGSQNGVPNIQSLGTMSSNGQHQPTLTYDSAGNKTTISYTAWGAPLTVTTYQGNTGPQLDQIRYYYGTQAGVNFNRLVEVRKNTTFQASFSYDTSGRVITMTDVRGITVGYQYDDLDNVIQTTYPDTTTEKVEYDCCSVPRKVTDRSGRETLYGHDSLKRLRSVTDADNKTLLFDYDREGNRTYMRDARGLETRWAYDGDGRATSKTYPGGTTERWNYNTTTGFLVSSVNARAQTINYGYNAWGEITNIDYPTTADVGFSRDGLGRIYRMDHGYGLGSTSWNYDSAGRAFKETGPWGNDEVEHYFDGRNNLSQTRVGSNNGQDVVNYGYDMIGRLNQVSATTGNWGNVAGVRGTTWDMSYVGWSQMPLTQTRPNGGYSEWNYETNDLKRLTRVSNKVSAPTTVLSRFTYNYGSAPYAGAPVTINLDNRTSLAKQYGNNPAETQTTTYNYNRTSMLTGESAQTAGNASTPALYKSYGFDAMGNRTSYNDNIAQVSATSSYNNLNQLTQTSLNTGYVTNYGCDNDGNTIGAYTTYYGVGSSNALYTYDEASRLTAIESKSNLQASVPDTRTEFVYDGLSRLRISRYYTKQSNGQLALQNEKRRVYDGMDVVQERNANNIVTASYTRTGNIGGILARTTGAGNAGSVFYGYDGAGNVTTLTNGSGAEVGSYTYDAFGNTVASSGAMANENPYRFSTKEQIGGLYSYGLRFYSPGIGRWINRDPIGEAGGTNLYGFNNNSPANYVDPDGASPLLITGAIGAVGGGVIGGGVAWWQGADSNGILRAAGRGALVGGIAGLTGGAVGGITTTMLAGTSLGASATGAVTSAVISGGVSGAASAGVGQMTELAMGSRCSMDWGEVGMSAGLGAVSGGAMGQHQFIHNSKFGITVTHWYSQSTAVSSMGRIRLQSGRWVQLGRPNFLSYMLTGTIQKGYGYGRHVVRKVPMSQLGVPPGGESSKWLIGQRVLK